MTRIQGTESDSTITILTIKKRFPQSLVSSHLNEESFATLDERPVERIRTCTQAGFPLCLEEALRTIFGNDGKRLLDSYLKTQWNFEESSLSSPRDLYNAYEKYITNFADKFGKDVAHVIEFETLKKMDSRCSKCALHQITS